MSCSFVSYLSRKMFLLAEHSLYRSSPCFGPAFTICSPLYIRAFFPPRSFLVFYPSSLLSYLYHLSSSVLCEAQRLRPRLWVRLAWPTLPSCPFQHRPLSQLLTQQICFLFGSTDKLSVIIQGLYPATQLHRDEFWM